LHKLRELSLHSSKKWSNSAQMLLNCPDKSRRIKKNIAIALKPSAARA